MEGRLSGSGGRGAGARAGGRASRGTAGGDVDGFVMFFLCVSSCYCLVPMHMHRDNIYATSRYRIYRYPIPLETCFDRRHRRARVGTSPDAVAQGDNPAKSGENKIRCEDH